MDDDGASPTYADVMISQAEDGQVLPAPEHVVTDQELIDG